MTKSGPSPLPEARVLVVDDEAHVRSALAHSLSLLGYRADEADSGHRALEMLERISYDVMVLDIRMPGIDGIEVMRRVRHVCPDLLIIVLTGHATLESAISAVKSGAVDYLLKPASVHDIAAVAAQALQKRAARLRRQQLLGLMGQALDEIHQIETGTTGPSPLLSLEDRFLRVGPITLDREKRLAVVVGTGGTGSRSAELTESEVMVLAYLMQHADIVLSCRELARDALGYDVSEREARNIVRPHISRLRNKIDPGSAQSCLIRTIPGKGYLFAF